MLTSELMSNTAVAALLLPIMAVLGSATELDPILFMAPVAFATSYGFMMPVGTPPKCNCDWKWARINQTDGTIWTTF